MRRPVAAFLLALAALAYGALPAAAQLIENLGALTAENAKKYLEPLPEALSGTMNSAIFTTGNVPVTGINFSIGIKVMGVSLGGLEANARASWDDVTGYWSLMTRCPLPSWLTQWRTEEGEDALRIYYQRNRLGTYDAWSAYAYDLGLVDPRDYQILQQPSAFNPLLFELSRGATIYNWPLLVEARRPFIDFGVLAQDADITAAPLRLVVAAAKSIAGHERRELNDRLPMWDHDFVREQKRIASQLNQPAVDERAGQSWQVWSA